MQSLEPARGQWAAGIDRRVDHLHLQRNDPGRFFVADERRDRHAVQPDERIQLVSTTMQTTSFVETGAQSSSEPPGPRPPSSPKEARTIAQRGQMLVVFVMSIFVIVGLVGLVIDVSWYWTNTLRVQRAADAAALAGAVQLPSRPATGRADARSQAEKNGYPSLTAACPIGPSTPLPAICAAQDATNRNQMNVTVSAPVGTFFMRVFGIGSITATRASKALYTLPVPMGSPENYYGVFGDVRNATMTNVPPPETDPVATTALKVPTTSPGTATWTVTPTSPSRTLVQAVATNETAAPSTMPGATPTGPPSSGAASA